MAALIIVRSASVSSFETHQPNRYGLNDQDVLCCYAGAEARRLDSRWNAFPTREPIPADVRLVHFAGGAKPWQSLPVPSKEKWVAARERYRRRLESVDALVGTGS